MWACFCLNTDNCFIKSHLSILFDIASKSWYVSRLILKLGSAVCIFTWSPQMLKTCFRSAVKLILCYFQQASDIWKYLSTFLEMENSSFQKLTTDPYQDWQNHMGTMNDCQCYSNQTVIWLVCQLKLLASSVSRSERLRAVKLIIMLCYSAVAEKSDQYFLCNFSSC